MTTIPEQYTTDKNPYPAPTWERPGLYWNPVPKTHIATRYSGIIDVTKYRNAPALLATARGVTQEVSAPMCSKSIPNSTIESIPYGYCHCGCGRKTNVAKRSNSRHGHVKGQPLKYLRYHKPGGSEKKSGLAGVEWSEEDACYLVPLSRGQYAKVDPSDLDKVTQHKWTARKGGENTWYAYRRDTSTGVSVHISMHRFIMNAPVGTYVDHINHDGLDNRKNNLRLCTNQQNTFNTRGPQKNNRSGYLGVFWSRVSGKWTAQIAANGKKYHLGLFDDAAEAARARDVAAILLHGEFATLNFPDEVTA